MIKSNFTKFVKQKKKAHLLYQRLLVGGWYWQKQTVGRFDTHLLHLFDNVILLFLVTETKNKRIIDVFADSFRFRKGVCSVKDKASREVK